MSDKTNAIVQVKENNSNSLGSAALGPNPKQDKLQDEHRASAATTFYFSTQIPIDLKL